MKAWTKVLSSGSQLDYEENWDTFYNTYWTDYSDLVVYLRDTWLPFKWNLVQFWVDQNLHFGNRATSRVEGAHSVLKNYLQVSTGNLKTVLDKITLLLTNQHTEHDTALDQERQRIPHDVNIPIFAELVGKVTPFALRNILKQYKRLSALPLNRCTQAFMESMGLPCAHLIQN